MGIKLLCRVRIHLVIRKQYIYNYQVVSTQGYKCFLCNKLSWQVMCYQFPSKFRVCQFPPRLEQILHE